jgi:hypothetical protein
MSNLFGSFFVNISVDDNVDEVVVKDYIINHPLIIRNIEECSSQILKDYKLIPEYLLSNYNKQQDSFKFINNAFPGEDFLVKSMCIAKKGCLTIKDPFYGNEVSSIDMLTSPSVPWSVVPVYGYRFSVADKIFYYLFIGHTMCQEIGFYFPEIDLVIVNHKINVDSVKSYIEDWRLYFLLNFNKIFHSIPKDQQSKPVVLIMNSHFAHNYWNELAFVEALVNNGLHKKVGFVCRSSPLGRLSDIFPEISENQITYIESDYHDFYNEVLKKSLFCIPCGRFFIPKSLRERVIKYSIKRNPHVNEGFTRLAKSYFPVVWVSLRTDARCWTNQLDGLSSLLIELSNKWPNMVVLIDGTSYADGLTYSSSTVDERNLLNEHSKAIIDRKK